MSDKMIDSAHAFGAHLDAQRWAGGIKFVLQGAMRAPVGEHGVTLEASWRADVFYPGSRKAAFTLIGNSPADVLGQLAGLSEDN